MTPPPPQPTPTVESLASPPPPPRAFAQGVGTVFQFVGVTFFLCSMFVCCGTSFLGKTSGKQSDRATTGSHFAGDGAEAPTCSAQRALGVCMLAAVFFGLAVAGIGLGLQAQTRRAPVLAVAVTVLAVVFWIGHAIFFGVAVRSAWLTVACALLAILFAGLLVLSIGAVRDFRRDPPPRGLEVLPKDYVVPYSHMHQDPPEVRLARELESRRERLAVQEAELRMLEERLRKKIDRPPHDNNA